MASGSGTTVAKEDSRGKIFRINKPRNSDEKFGKALHRNGRDLSGTEQKRKRTEPRNAEWIRAGIDLQ